MGRCIPSHRLLVAYTGFSPAPSLRVVVVIRSKRNCGFVYARGHATPHGHTVDSEMLLTTVGATPGTYIVRQVYV